MYTRKRHIQNFAVPHCGTPHSCAPINPLNCCFSHKIRNPHSAIRIQPCHRTRSVHTGTRWYTIKKIPLKTSLSHETIPPPKSRLPFASIRVCSALFGIKNVFKKIPPFISSVAPNFRPSLFRVFRVFRGKKFRFDRPEPKPNQLRIKTEPSLITNSPQRTKQVCSGDMGYRLFRADGLHGGICHGKRVQR